MMRLWLYYFTFIVVFCGILRPAQAANQICLQASNYGDVFNLKGALNHDARLIADQIDERNLRLDIQRLSGRIGLECATGPCIADRYMSANKEAIHRFFVDRIQSLGLTPKFEQFGNSRSSGVGFPAAVDMDNLSGEDRDRILASSSLFIYLSFINDEMKERVNYDNWRNYLTIEKLENALELFATIPEGKGFRRATYSRMKDTLERIVAALRAGENIHEPAEISNDPQNQKIRDVFPEYDPRKNTNITVTITGTEKADEVFEIVAHYDTVYPDVGGADDNGSGLATALEMIRLFTVNPPKKTLRFVFTDMEEQGGEGADHHLKTIDDWDEEFLGAFVIDMYGYAQLGTNPQFVLEVGQRRDYNSDESFASGVRLAEAFAFQYGRYKGRTAKYTNLVEEARGDTGDHGSYWQADFPAIFIAQPVDRPNPANHSQADRIENMNWGFFTEVARLITETTALVSGAVLNADRVPSVERLRYIDGLHNPNVSPEQVRVVGERSADRSGSSRSSSSSHWGLFEFEDYLNSGKPIDFANLNYTQSSLIIASLHFRELKKYLQASGFQVDDMFLRRRMNREFLEYHRDKVVRNANTLSDAGVAPNLTISDIDFWLARIKGPGQTSSSSRTVSTERGIANDIKEGKKLISATLSDRDLGFVANTVEWQAFGLYVRNQGTFDSNEWIRRNLNLESLIQWKNQVKNDEKISYDFEAEVLESLEFWLTRVAPAPIPAQSTPPTAGSIWTSVGTTGMPASVPAVEADPTLTIEVIGNVFGPITNETFEPFVPPQDDIDLDDDEYIEYSALTDRQALALINHSQFGHLKSYLESRGFTVDPPLIQKRMNERNLSALKLEVWSQISHPGNSTRDEITELGKVYHNIQYWLARAEPKTGTTAVSENLTRVSQPSPEPEPPQMVVPMLTPTEQLESRIQQGAKLDIGNLNDDELKTIIDHVHFYFLSKYLRGKGVQVDAGYLRTLMTTESLTSLKKKIVDEAGEGQALPEELQVTIYNIEFWLRRLN